MKIINKYIVGSALLLGCAVVDVLFLASLITILQLPISI